MLLTTEFHKCEETVVPDHKPDRRNEPAKSPERTRKEQPPKEGRDRASNPASDTERPIRQDPQFDPGHINES